MKVYTDGYKLEEDEYLLKVQKNVWNDGSDKGFLTKFNKDGSMPVAFKDWPCRRYTPTSEADFEMPIYIHKERFRPGWRIMSWRFGMSQNWASLIHPDGFTVEVYLDQLLEIIKEFSTSGGTLIGEFKWEGHKLICKSHIKK